MGTYRESSRAERNLSTAGELGQHARLPREVNVHRFLIGLAVAVLALPCAAQEAPEGLAERIAASASDCWNVLPSERNVKNVVVLDVELGEGGEVVGRPRVVSAPKGPAIALGRAGQRAVIECGPYEHGYVGHIRITMTPDID